MEFSTPPSLRDTSPISAHRRVEEEVVVKASSFTNVRDCTIYFTSVQGHRNVG